MKEISLQLLSQTIQSKRKAKGITQADLSKESGIHRSIISKIESMEHIPSVNQLAALSEILEFDIKDLFIDPNISNTKIDKCYNIAVAGTGYVGLSNAIILAQQKQPSR